MFHVGQKVVCIRGWEHYAGRFRVPKEGQTYTIRAIEIGDDGTGDLFFRFSEIVNPPGWYCNGFNEPAFFEGAFRPVAERKTDISIFTEMLAPKTEKATA